MVWIALLFVVTCVLVGILSSLWSGTGNTAWYASIAKPTWQPPSWLFGPVWTILYILMGLAAYLIYKSPSSTLRTTALILFATQLLLNFFWTPIFFRYHLLGWALLEIIVLLGFIIATTTVFYLVDKRAAALMIPYIAWVTFATILNATIYHMN